jgi:mono/diheme cytochrome c family protein
VSASTIDRRPVTTEEHRVTEVPEHLLQRSRDRRAALGLGGEGGDKPAEAAAAPAETPSETAPAATAAAKPAAAPAEVEAKAPEPPPPYVEAAVTRKRIPVWAMPVLGFLPLWVILYAGSLSPAATGGAGELELGAEVYASRCASCHGGGGGGGVGRALSNGEVLLTFPDIEQMIEFVAVGTDGIGTGTPYGDPDRPGGAHVAGSFGVMPAFADSLTPEELLAVVRHEREALSGELIEGELVDAEGHRLWPNGEPIVVDGELVTPDGEPLLGDDGRLTIQIADSE